MPQTIFETFATMHDHRHALQQAQHVDRSLNVDHLLDHGPAPNDVAIHFVKLPCVIFELVDFAHSHEFRYE